MISHLYRLYWRTYRYVSWSLDEIFILKKWKTRFNFKWHVRFQIDFTVTWQLSHSGPLTPYCVMHISHHWFYMSIYSVESGVSLFWCRLSHQLSQRSRSERTSIIGPCPWIFHYNHVIMSAMASQIIGVPILCSTVGSGADQRKHQGSASPAFVRGIHRWPMNSPHKRPVTRKMFPFHDVIMCL